MSDPKFKRNNPDDWKVIVLSDETTTVAELMLQGVVMGRGVAKRRKGEERNAGLGHTLALTRAFRDAARTLGKELQWGA